MMAADNTAQMPPDTRAATVLPVQQATKEFTPSGALMIPNAIRPPNGMSDRSFLQAILPYAAKVSPISKAQQEAQP